MIIDAHIHLDLYFNQNITPQQRVADLKNAMQRAGIDQAIVLQDIYATSDPLTTQQILELVDNENSLFLAGTITVTNHQQQDVERLNELLSQNLLVGIKLYPGYETFYPIDERCQPIYDLCEKFNVPVIFHSGATFEGIVISFI